MSLSVEDTRRCEKLRNQRKVRSCEKLEEINRAGLVTQASHSIRTLRSISLVITMPAVKTCEVFYKKRIYIYALRFKAGWAYSRIVKDQHVRISTAWNICHGLETPRGGKGRPFKISAPTRCLLIDTATLNTKNCRKPYTEVGQDLGIGACEDTFCKVSKKEGYSH